jgi:hypothetical protein
MNFMSYLGVNGRVPLGVDPYSERGDGLLPEWSLLPWSAGKNVYFDGSNQEKLKYCKD